jgi:hypothetical protein
VSFPRGMITEWYPNADYQVYQKSRKDGSLRLLEKNLNGIDISMNSVTGGLEWTSVRVQPDTAPLLPLENKPSRYYAARGTDAAPLEVGDQHEKFLFYRGVGSPPLPLSARVSAAGRIVAANRGAAPVPDVILFENRGGRLGFRNAGLLLDSVTLDLPSLDASFALLQHDLESALVSQGLFAKEAQAMIATWKDSWFEEGARLIYIMPSPAVDAMVPLQIDPAPARISRVFVGRIELITPETQRAVTEAVAHGDNATLDRYARFLEPILARVAHDNPSLKVPIDHIRQQRAAALFAECR